MLKEKSANPKAISYITLLFTVIIWGLSFLSTKIAVAEIPPMTLALFRFIIAIAILLPVFKWKEPETKLDKNDQVIMFFAGITGVSLYFFFENKGLKLITASSASIITAMIPILTVLAERLILKKPMSMNKYIGVILSFVGVFFVVNANLSGLNLPGIFSSGSGLGYILMFGAVFSWIIYSFLTRSLVIKYSQLAIVYYQTLYGTIALIPFSILEIKSWHMVSFAINLNVVFLAVFCSVLGYLFYNYSLEHLGISITSIFINLIPVVTVIASFFILKEKTTSMQMSGGLIVIASVYIANWKFGKK